MLSLRWSFGKLGKNPSESKHGVGAVVMAFGFFWCLPSSPLHSTQYVGNLWVHFVGFGFYSNLIFGFCFLVFKYILNSANRSKPSFCPFFKALGYLCNGCRLKFQFCTFIHHCRNFVVRVADWTNDILSQWNFVVHVADWTKDTFIGRTIFCHSEILSFALLIGRRILCHNEILSSVLLRLKSVRIIFTVVFVNKSQYLWKKRKVDVIVMKCWKIIFLTGNAFL